MDINKQPGDHAKDTPETQAEREERFRGFFACAPEAMFLTDEQGCIIEWNPAAERLFSLPAEDILGKHLTKLHRLMEGTNQRGTSPLERAWVELHEALRRGEIPWANHCLEGEIYRPDGQAIHLEQTLFPIPSEGGFRFAGIYRDTTEEHLVEQREQRRHALLERVIQLGKSVSRITNLQRCYQEIYQCIQQGLGFDRVGLFEYDPVRQQVKGIIGTERSGGMGDKSWLVQDIQPGDTWSQILASPQGIHFVDNTRTTPKEGDNMVGVKENAVVAAWAGEQPVGFIAVDNLLSGRPFTPEQVEALQLFAGYVGMAIQNARWNEEMEKRVVERTIALEVANRELESLSYTIAHDLRSPLRAVVGYSKILQENHSILSDTERLSTYHKIHREGLRMGRMVDDFLHFLYLGRTPIHKRTVDMVALAKRAVEAVQATLFGREIVFSVGQMPPCQADPDLVYEALNELLDNAVHFTANRERGEVEIGAMTQLDETWYFVRDNGIGFDMAYASKLFGVFQRLHPPSANDDEGTGIGLANVKRIITRHGGRIWAEAEENKGATFYFTLG